MHFGLIKILLGHVLPFVYAWVWGNGQNAVAAQRMQGGSAAIRDLQRGAVD